MKARLQSAALGIAAALTTLIAYSPFLLDTYQISTIRYYKNNSQTVPMTVVGVNYPISSAIIAGAAFLFMLFFMLLWSRRKRDKSLLFWINGFSISIIFSNIIIWFL